MFNVKNEKKEQNRKKVPPVEMFVDEPLAAEKIL